MNRKKFLEIMGYSAAAAVLVPKRLIALPSNLFSENILIGKQNMRLKGTNQLMIDEAYDAFNEMSKEALKSGIQLQVVSGYRSFNRQQAIWNRKYNEFIEQGNSPQQSIEKIIEYSTIPGTSRHHWGTDIDVIDAAATQPRRVLQTDHFYGNGPFCRMKDWMMQHSEKFGFYEVYTFNFHRKGFKHEPWHFSYKPIAKPMLEAYLKLDIKSIIKNNTTLNGNEHLTDAFISNYIKYNIMGINPELLS